MTPHVPGRHRAAVRPLTSFAHAVTTTASGAGRGVAVLAAAGGLVATIALPASAAPEAAPATVPASVGAAAPTAVDSAFGTAVPAVVSAPAAAAVVTTAATFTAVPTPAPVVVVPAVTTKAAVSVKPTITVKRKARGATAAPKVQAVLPDAPAPAEAQPAAVAAVEVVAQAAPPASGLGDRILNTASQYAGIPYVYGGTTPAGFDCSGFTGYVMRQNGVSLPRTADAQKNASTRIDRSQAVPGDLVFFSSGGRAYHVGIYAGGNKMWDSPRTGKPVALRTIWSSTATFGRVAPVA